MTIVLIVTNTKFLGVIIDDRLNWSNHISSIKTKIAKGIGIIYKAKKLLNENTLVTLYYSFVYPYLYYGIIAWGKTTSNFLNSLVILQKRVIRIISSATRLAHTEPLFRRLRLLKLEDIYILNVMLFMFQIRRGYISLFQDLFTLNSEIHDHNTRQSAFFHLPIPRLEIRKRSIYYQGPIVWNGLVNEFETLVHLNTFKRNVKRFLIENEVSFLVY